MTLGSSISLKLHLLMMARVIIYDYHMFMVQATEHLTIVNDDSRVINKLEASLTDNG